jgi:hypothetical protein
MYTPLGDMLPQPSGQCQQQDCLLGMNKHGEVRLCIAVAHQQQQLQEHVVFLHGACGVVDPLLKLRQTKHYTLYDAETRSSARGYI